MLVCFNGPSRPLDLWIKIDTGMHRLGFAPERGRAVFEALRGASFLRAAPRLMTHLACADERDGTRTHEQVRLFDAAVAGLEAEQSIANSAGVLAWPWLFLALDRFRGVMRQRALR